jgi:hypothetical protein
MGEIKIELDYNELLLLDGKISSKVKKTIDDEKMKKNIGFELDIMNKIVLDSIRTGIFSCEYVDGRSCGICEKKYDYRVYKRKAKNHNRGEKNYNDPIYYRCVKFNMGSIFVRGIWDMCFDCYEKYDVLNRIIHYIFDNDLKIEIRSSGIKTKYIKDDVRICFKCKEEMYKSEMIEISAGELKCPKCGATSTPFEVGHKYTDKFRMLLKTGEKI